MLQIQSNVNLCKLLYLPPALNIMKWSQSVVTSFANKSQVSNQFES